MKAEINKVKINEEMKALWKELPLRHNAYKYGNINNRAKENLYKHLDLVLDLEEKEGRIVFEMPLLDYIYKNYKKGEDKKEFAERIIKELKSGEMEDVIQENWFSAYKDKQGETGYWRNYAAIRHHRYIPMSDLEVSDILEIIGEV